MTACRRATLALALAGAGACGAPRPAAPRGPAAVAADSVRGIVEQVGNIPLDVVQLRAAGGTIVPLDGPWTSTLRPLAGVDVVARGTRAAGGRLTVASFEVRAVAGIAAVDGTLVREANGVALATADGRRLAVPHLPGTLRGRVGARVYLAGPLDAPPSAYGIITPAP